MSSYARAQLAWATTPAADPRETARVLAGNPKPVSIVATSDKFQIAGQPAVVGETYTVTADVAASLVHVGKAKRL